MYPIGWTLSSSVIFEIIGFGVAFYCTTLLESEMLNMSNILIVLFYISCYSITKFSFSNSINKDNSNEQSYL